jgi:transcriptional regulator with XRE-family HTH domain
MPLNIKISRVKQGLTQLTVSQASNISQGRLSLLERGLIEPTTDERQRLAEVLHAAPMSLFRSAVRSTRAVSVNG